MHTCCMYIVYEFEAVTILTKLEDGSEERVVFFLLSFSTAVFCGGRR